MAGDDEVNRSQACDGACVATAIQWSIAILRLHLKIDWGEHGACTTDVGPEHVTANTGTLPAVLALREAMGLDFTAILPQASWILPWWTLLMVPSNSTSPPMADYGEC